MVRTILSVLAGYAIFVVTSLALFKFSGQNPHADTTNTFIILTALYGASFSFMAGIITQRIAKTKTLAVNYVLAIIMAGFATFSFFKTDGNHWTQLLAIFIFAPLSLVGGLFSIKRTIK